MSARIHFLIFIALGLFSAGPVSAESPSATIPSTVDELWANFDPSAESLEVEILKTWEEEGVTMKVLRYRVGTFKGEPARMAAIYGYPTGDKKVPGLVQIHGGGQYADSNAVLTNGQRGYATISVAWAGRISTPGYRVNPDVVKLFWENKTSDPNYRVTTDWGAVDGYHAPSRHQGTSFPSVRPHPWTIDDVESPRNSGWYLCAMATRRALTFLEKQPEVDATRLGIYGHSMGGKLTVMTAIDSRVQAAAPSCGGISDRENNSELFESSLGDQNYLKQIRCPIFFLSPSNDFHGRIDDLQTAVTEIQSQDWRVTCSPHHNHQDTAPYEVATQLWFDKHLMHNRSIPETPNCSVDLNAPSGMPAVVVATDNAQQIIDVDIYYTRHGQIDGEQDDRDNTKAKFWHHVKANKQGEHWRGELSLLGTDQPLWVYANVTYALDPPITGAGYYYRTYSASQFVLSSLMTTFTPEQLDRAGVRSTREPTKMIEDFEGDWQKEWFTYRPEEWAITTHKIYDTVYAAPSNASLSIEVHSEQANDVVILIDDYAAVAKLDGGSEFQNVVVSLDDFRNYAGESLDRWQGTMSFKLCSSQRQAPSRGESGNPRMIGQPWKGPAPKFSNFIWITDHAEPETDHAEPENEF